MQNAFKAKKRFGQHFLKDKFVVEKIIQSIADDDLQIVEIGAGLGDLTKELLKKNSVYAYEIDKFAVDVLEEKFKDELSTGRLVLHNADILSAFHAELLDKRYKIVANLPYNIGTEIILRGLKDKNCEAMLVMLQQEVGEKFYAKLGDLGYSSLSVLMQSAAVCVKILDVAPSAFEPPPKVWSVVINIKKTAPSIDRSFARFIKMCFSAPRKPLIKAIGLDLGKDAARKIFDKTGLDPLVRAHQLSLSQFQSLFAAINKGI
ncbi:MAG: 16S rRNA (adenine(1518)-N(6)/adenine(1519)-N(6))-dimethyltransferase RsmA [Helicobacteraceae bacterium]